MKLQLLTAIMAGPILTAAALWANSIPRADSMLFAVHADPQWVRSSDGNRTILMFRLQLAVWLLATVGLAVSPAFLLAPALLPVMGTVSFAAARAAVRKHAVPNTQVRTASLAEERDGTSLGLLLCAGALIPLTACAFWLNGHWDSIPARFPVHWDIQGHPNRWNMKTPAGVYGVLIVGAATTLLLLILALATLWGSPRGGSGIMRRATLRMFAGISWLANLLLCAISLNQALRLNLPIPILTLALVGGIATLLWPVLKASANTADSTSDASWTWGVFYCNPDDPALFVPARLGAGYTLNLGNRMAWIISAASLAVPIVAFAVTRS